MKKSGYYSLAISLLTSFAAFASMCDADDMRHPETMTSMTSFDSYQPYQNTDTLDSKKSLIVPTVLEKSHIPQIFKGQKAAVALSTLVGAVIGGALGYYFDPAFQFEQKEFQDKSQKTFFLKCFKQQSASIWKVLLGIDSTYKTTSSRNVSPIKGKIENHLKVSHRILLGTSLGASLGVLSAKAGIKLYNWWKKPVQPKKLQTKPVRQQAP